MALSATELSSAVSNPLRRRILFAHLDGELERASVAQVAATLDERMSQVAYHLKVLATAGVLRQLPEDEERRYGFAPGIDPAWLRLVLELSADSGVPD